MQGTDFTKGSYGGADSFEGGTALSQKLVFGIDPTNTSSLAGYDEQSSKTYNRSSGNTSPSGVISGMNTSGINGGNTSPFTYSPSYIATYGTYDTNEQNNIESMNLECETNLKDHRFSGNVGKIFRVKCPSCISVKKPVYGSYIYHPLSSICKSAAHAGTLNPKYSGYIIVELVSGKKIYNGSYGADGNLSGTFSSADISFKTKAGSPPMKITCDDSPNKAPFNGAPSGAKFVVICPSSCAANKSSIYGSEIYADMSPICASAIHYGVLSDKGGEIEFLIQGNQNYFKGTRSFGLISKSRDAYVRSFRFIGVKSAIFYKFKEDYKNNISSKWHIFSNENVYNRESNSWEYFDYKYFDTSQAKNTIISTIHHTGVIRSGDDNSYGSYLILKNVEWSNGRVQANILFKDTKQVAFLFRYQDKDNYYSIEFDLLNLRNNVRLMTKVDSTIKIIEAKHIPLNVEIWYRITLIMNNDQISVSIQTDTIRENKSIFEHTLELISRGTIGFASNGNDNFYLSGIEVDDFILHKSNKLDKKNKRTWNDLLKHTDSKSIKLYCNDLFRSDDPQELSRCMYPHMYCKLRCDDHIPTVENILNYNCFKDCINKIGFHNNESVMEREAWTPSIGTKIDFSPDSNGSYLPAFIVSMQDAVENGETVKIFNISYYDNAGNSMKTTSKYPSANISQCGFKLTRRKDCD